MDAGRHVRNNQDGLIAARRRSDKRNHAHVRIGWIDPVKSTRLVVSLEQRGTCSVDPVEVSHQDSQALVPLILQQRPIQLAIVIPLPDLSELVPHEIHLFAGVCVHIRIVEPQVGKLLPLVPWHFGEQ